MQTRPERTDFRASMAAAIVLHLAVFLSFLIVWPYFGKPVEVVNATAVTLVPSPAAPPPPALKAEEEHEATAPEPTPKPAPPQPAPTPTPKPSPKPKTESLDLSALSKSLDKSAAKSQPKASTAKESLDLSALSNSLEKPQKPQGATRGPARPETAFAARTDPGAPSTASLGAAIGQKIMGLWHPDCGAEGGRDVNLIVRLSLNQSGVPTSVDVQGASNSPVVQAAIARAKVAVRLAAPFELPRESYGQWQSVVVRLNASNACSG